MTAYKSVTRVGSETQQQDFVSQMLMDAHLVLFQTQSPVTVKADVRQGIGEIQRIEAVSLNALLDNLATKLPLKEHATQQQTFQIQHCLEILCPNSL